MPILLQCQIALSGLITMMLARSTAPVGLTHSNRGVSVRPRLHVRAKAGDDNPFAGPATTSSNPSTSKPVDEARIEEAKLELLEAQVRGNKRAIQAASAAKKAIPIKGMVTKQDESTGGNMAPWREGQLFPDGWDAMPLPQKVTELYMGRRGVLFWANKAAYASVFILLGGWVLFRFVGPLTGLYSLEGDLVPPPM